MLWYTRYTRQRRVISHLWSKGEGMVTYEDFIDGVLRCKGPARAIDQTFASRMMNFSMWWYVTIVTRLHTCFSKLLLYQNWMSRLTKAWLFAREELQRILRAVFILSCCQGFVCNAMSRTWQTPWSFLTNNVHKSCGNFQTTTVCIASFHPALGLVLSQFLAASPSLACTPGHWCHPWRRTRSSGESVAKGEGGGSTKRTYCCLTILFRLFHFVRAAFYTYYLLFANTCAALEIHTHALFFSHVHTGTKHVSCSSDDERSARHARCRQLAAEGELSRACAALVAPPLIQHSPGVMDKLRAKHPRAQPALAALLPLGPPARTDVPDIAAADVVAAVRSFRRGSAAGPSGLRGDHLREALSSAHGDEVAAHFGWGGAAVGPWGRTAGSCPPHCRRRLACLAKTRGRCAAYCCRGNLTPPCFKVPLPSCSRTRSAMALTFAARGHGFPWGRGCRTHCPTLFPP